MEPITQQDGYYTYGRWVITTQGYKSSENFSANITRLRVDISQFTGEKDLLFFLDNGDGAVYLLKNYKSIYTIRPLLLSDIDYASHMVYIIQFYLSKLFVEEPNPQIAKRCRDSVLIYLPANTVRNILELFPDWTINGKVTTDIFGNQYQYPHYEIERKMINKSPVAITAGTLFNASISTPPASTFGATPTPTFGATPTPTFGATPTPTFGATPASTFGATPASTFGATPASTFGATPTPTFGSTPTPTFGSTPTPTFGATPVSKPVSTFGATPSTPAATPASIFGAKPVSTFGAIPGSSATKPSFVSPFGSNFSSPFSSSK